MSPELLKAISDLPTILQGALGSGVFWFILFIGQKIANYSSNKYSESSKKRRIHYIREQRLKYMYKLTDDTPARGVIFTALIYRAFRSFLKGLIWLVLGLLTANILDDVFALIGYVGCLYYLFAALTTVTSVPEEDDAEEKFKVLGEELAQLENSNSPTQTPT